MREPGRPDDVARGVDALDAGLVAIVGLEVAAIVNSSFSFPPGKSGSTPMATSRLRLRSFPLSLPSTVIFTPCLVVSVFVDFRVGQNLDSLFRVGLFQRLRDLGVFDRQNFGSISTSVTFVPNALKK